MIELSEEQRKDLEEMATHGGWRVYQLLLKDLASEIELNWKNKKIRKAEDLVESAVEQARLELLENVITPLVKDTLGGEEENR